MPDWPKQNAAAMNAFYGNPDSNQDGKADASWEKANLVKIVPPYDLYYPTEAQGKLIKRGKKFSGLWMNSRCSDSLLICLALIQQNFSRDEIQKYELDICAGTYVFKMKKGGSSLSTHSWGCAIDLSQLINAWGRKYDVSKDMMPKGVVDIFKAEGWTWGGLWSTPDAMHFQAADV